MSGGELLVWLIFLWSFASNVCCQQQTVISTDQFRPLQKLIYSDDQLYVAGTDRIYRLNITSLAVSKSSLLNGTERCGSTCSSKVTVLEAYNSTHLFLCFTYLGRCALLGKTELKATALSERNIVTDNSNLGTVVFVEAIVSYSTESQEITENSLWITNSYSANNAFAMAIWRPDTFQLVYQGPSTLKGSGPQSALEYRKNATNLQYVYAFHMDGLRFYVKNQNGLSYLGGVCSNDPLFTTLVELPLQCTSEGGLPLKFVKAAYMARAASNLYHILQRSEPDVPPSDIYLFGLFAKNATSSSISVCAFSVRALIKRLNSVFTMCHDEGNSEDVHVGPDELLNGAGVCRPFQSDNDSLRGVTSACDIIRLPDWNRRVGLYPLVYQNEEVRASIIDLQFDSRAFYVKAVGNKTVAFMVDPLGYICKVVIGVQNMHRGLYKREDLMIGDELLLPSIAVGNDRIYALTDTTVFSVPVQRCHTATTCEMCSALEDPHCGWCALSSSCTTMSNCTDHDSQGHWLQRGMGCISPELDTELVLLDVPGDLVKLKVTLNAVPLNGQNERYLCCYFGEMTEVVCEVAVKKVIVDLQSPGDYLECPTPSKEDILSRMAPNKDHIVSKLALKVEDKQFAEVTVTFYSCSRHTRCTSCVETRSDFKCSWCLETYRCYNSDPPQCPGPSIANTMDQTSALAGSDKCPRISVDGGSNVLLVPSGILPNNIAMSLHNRQEYMTRFSCKLTWDEEVKLYQARVSGQAPKQSLQCLINNSLSYLDDEPTKQVHLSIIVNDGKYIDNPDQVQVEVYKCDKMKKTCSECLSGIERKYQCGWCESTSKNLCQVSQLCERASSGTFLEDNNSSCPYLEISQINPLRGPIQGGTSLTIKGVNLGKSYDEIRGGVKVELSESQSVNCVVDEREPHSPFRVICNTSESIVGSGKVTVTPNAVNEQSEVYSAVSADLFSFEDVEVEGLSTRKGPISGGSKVVIKGKFVNIGSHREVVMILRNSERKECDILSTVNTSEIIFVTPKLEQPSFATIEVRIDKFSKACIYDCSIPDFTFSEDSTVISIIPNKGILSGGTYVSVKGTNLDLIQAPTMYLEMQTNSADGRVPRSAETPWRYEFPCSNITEKRMTCILPTLPLEWTSAQDIEYGFIMDNIESLLKLNEKEDFPVFAILPNPEFVNFGEKFVQPNVTLEITGKNFLDIADGEVVLPMVKVKLYKLDNSVASPLMCNVTAIRDEYLYCSLPQLETSAVYTVIIEYGVVLKETLGTISQRPETGLTTIHYVGIGVGISIVFIIVIVTIIVLKLRLSKTDEGLKKMQDKMYSREMTMARECKEAFTELQTDMTEMTADIAALKGLPFYQYKQYCMKVLFPTYEGDHPVMRVMEIQDGRDRETVQQGLVRFKALIYNKTFLLTLIRTLEHQKNFTMRERVELASYVSVALQSNMEYHTDILKTLLAELIDTTMTSAKKDPKILLRRNESVAEKMLSNWFAFLLQKFLKECAGEPLYLLYRAVKQQIDKGPVDAVTADAKYSLSEDKLLRQSIDSNSIHLKFCSPDPHAAEDPQTVKVLDCDTISQAIDKILDSLHRNVPSSTKPARDNLVLEWIKPDGQRVAMSDEDPQYSKVESDGTKKLVTLKCYKITDNAHVALTPRQQLASALPMGDTGSSTGNYYSSTGDSLSRANSLNNILDTPNTRERQRVTKYHLVKSSDADAHQEGDKMVSEIYLNRLLFTKGALQRFVDDLFETIFSVTHRGSALPLAIKYMFDFLDDQALLHNINNPEVIHHWKSNSLPLRFWVNVIKNPDFVFDIHKSSTVDACLTVVAQNFMDSCSLTEHRLGKDSPSSKLLYAKDIPNYRKLVSKYYSEIKSMPAISDHDMNLLLGEESRQHRNEFNANAALYELHQYVASYQGELMAALREDEFARKDRLADQLDRVNNLLNVTSRLN